MRKYFMGAPAELKLKAVKNILIIRLGGLGDVVCTTPVIRNMRRGFPDARITFLTREENAPALDGNPHINDLVVIPKEKQKLSFLQKQKTELQFLRDIRKKSFDVALNLSGGPRSSVITFATGASVRLGFTGQRVVQKDAPEKESENAQWKSNAWRDFRSRVYNVPLPTRWPLYVPELLLDSVRYFGITPDGARLEIFLSDDDEKFAGGFFTQNGIQNNQKVVCLNPGGMHASKRWPDEYFTELADLLCANDENIKILIIKPENYSIENITARMTVKPVVAENLPLKKVAAMLRKCSLFVSNDSGLKFAAVAVNVPTLTLFGSRGHVGATPPLSTQHVALFRELPCRPCYQSECPLGTLDCLRQITPQYVMNVIRKSFFDKLKSSAYV